MVYVFIHMFMEVGFMPRGFTEQERVAIRERLLAEGYKQFSAYGLKRTRVEELATAARISTGAFYLFYESKEALFMDVAELAEQRCRDEILAAVDLPGPSPRARLFVVFRRAFGLLKSIPLLQLFTSSDYEVLFRRVPAQKLEEHFASDRFFFDVLVRRCQEAGIPVVVPPDAISGVLYPLVLSSMHADGAGLGALSGGIDVLLELIAAFCLGEVDVQVARGGDLG